jgi:hypothetical protein
VLHQCAHLYGNLVTFSSQGADIRHVSPANAEKTIAIGLTSSIHRLGKLLTSLANT